MHRAHIKITKEGIQKGKVILWQYCPECKLVVPE